MNFAGRNEGRWVTLCMRLFPTLYYKIIQREMGSKLLVRIVKSWAERKQAG
jgi:hypothetical protein